ncbi:hypothetical protein B5X24_HaOG215420 [Helicoverpa armigera]|nr:hypothetical protein B5X24_HaOG215420 [Helicoverpa armigera]
MQRSSSVLQGCLGNYGYYLGGTGLYIGRDVRPALIGYAQLLQLLVGVSANFARNNFVRQRSDTIRYYAGP